MSHDIRVKATYTKQNLEKEFIMPRQGETTGIDFQGKLLAEVKNIKGEMIPTGNGMDGRGSPVFIDQDDIVFEILN